MDSSTPSATSPAPPVTAETAVAMPFETILIQALGKLTFQVFVFVLAYLTLVIGMEVFVPGLATRLKTLIHVLPLLGIGAYIRRRQRDLGAKAERHGINVKGSLVLGRARLTGARIKSGNLPPSQDISVQAGLAASDATIEGLVVGDDAGDALSTDARTLLKTFQLLDPPKQRKALTYVLGLVDVP